jgi:hypothetical protein
MTSRHLEVAPSPAGEPAPGRLPGAARLAPSRDVPDHTARRLHMRAVTTGGAGLRAGAGAGAR